MSRCENEMDEAKQAVLQERFLAWRRNWIKENQDAYESKEHLFARVPDPPDLAIETWVTFIWSTGFIIMDADDYNKLPPRRRKLFEKSIR